MSRSATAPATPRRRAAPAPCPAPIRHAILLMVCHYFNNRDAVTVTLHSGAVAAWRRDLAGALPRVADRLMDSGRFEHRARFMRRPPILDQGEDTGDRGPYAPVFTLWANFRPQSVREAAQGGAAQNVESGTLTVRTTGAEPHDHERRSSHHRGPRLRDRRRRPPGPTYRPHRPQCLQQPRRRVAWWTSARPSAGSSQGYAA